MPRPAQKPNDRNGSEKAENRRGGDIAFQREPFQEWRMIGNYQPCGEHESQTDANVQTGACRRVAHNAERTRPWQMWANQHRCWARTRLTMSYPGFSWMGP